MSLCESVLTTTKDLSLTLVNILSKHDRMRILSSLLALKYCFGLQRLVRLWGFWADYEISCKF